MKIPKQVFSTESELVPVKIGFIMINKNVYKLIKIVLQWNSIPTMTLKFTVRAGPLLFALSMC